MAAAASAFEGLHVLEVGWSRVGGEAAQVVGRHQLAQRRLVLRAEQVEQRALPLLAIPKVGGRVGPRPVPQPAEAVGAAYPGYLDQAVWEAMEREGKQNDFVMLGRASWAGSQRWGGGLWSGDVHSHWAVLSQQFTAGLNAAMSGTNAILNGSAVDCCAIACSTTLTLTLMHGQV